MASNLTNCTNSMIPEEWREAAYAIKNHPSSSKAVPITVICGPKNSGKSTFSHHLVNTFLEKYKKVGYLDTDVGQPEFTVCGVLSLTVIDTPNYDFTIPCIKNSERSYFYGDVSSKRNPTLYKAMVQSLFDYYQTDYCRVSANQEIPLVINTPGWVKGVGYDTLVEMLRFISPSFVIKINTSSSNKNLPNGAFWSSNELKMVTLIEINSLRIDSSSKLLMGQKDASLRRDMKIMGYFRQCVDNHKGVETIKELANALSSQLPYQVSYSSMKIVHLHYEVCSGETWNSLNASIVGLGVGCDYGFPQCVGLGIVRSVDPERGFLYVITPVESAMLKDVNTLLLGCIQIPLCLLQVQRCISPYMAIGVLPSW